MIFLCSYDVLVQNIVQLTLKQHRVYIPDPSPAYSRKPTYNFWLPQNLVVPPCLQGVCSRTYADTSAHRGSSSLCDMMKVSACSGPSASVCSQPLARNRTGVYWKNKKNPWISGSTQFKPVFRGQLYCSYLCRRCQPSFPILKKNVEGELSNLHHWFVISLDQELVSSYFWL